MVEIGVDTVELDGMKSRTVCDDLLNQFQQTCSVCFGGMKTIMTQSRQLSLIL